MCALSIDHYKPDIESLVQYPPKSPGPLIIGQEDTSLENALGNMSVSMSVNSTDKRGLYSSRTVSSPALSPRSYSSSSHKFISNRKDLNGENTAMSLGDYTQGCTSDRIGQRSCWGPAINMFSEYTLPSPVWSQFHPGTIGQERGVPSLPSHRQNYPQQQQRGQSRAGGRQHHEYATGHHNVVDVDRIRLGTDVRTTVRNADCVPKFERR